MLNFSLNKETDLVIDNVICRYYFHDYNTPLIITFAHADKDAQISSKAIEERANFKVWGYDFFKKNGYSVISFACINQPNWYRSQKFHDWLDGNKNFFDKFKTKFGYGSSMGGFAVGAFYDIFNFKSILIINPISTLNREKISSETRFKFAQENLNWKGKYNDRSSSEMNGFIIYDPIFHLDTIHAKRYKGLEKLKFFGLGHGLPYKLIQLNILKNLVISFIEEKLKKHNFQKAARSRKHYIKYYDWMLSSENIHLTSDRKKTILHYKNIFCTLNDKNYNISHYEINCIRDCAVALEKKGDFSNAFKLMSIARNARPKGPFIEKKLNYYKEKLK